MRTLLVCTSSLVLALCAATYLVAQSKDKVQSKYQILEVAPFEVENGVTLPADFQDKLAQHLLTDLKKTKKFTAVISPVAVNNVTAANPPATDTTAAHKPEAVPDSAAIQLNGASPVLLLTGTIIEFDPGSRGKRYLGLGIGAALVVAHVKFTDKADQSVIFERNIVGKLTGGAFGGSDSGAATDLSKEVARVVKKQVF